MHINLHMHTTCVGYYIVYTMSSIWQEKVTSAMMGSHGGTVALCLLRPVWLKPSRLRPSACIPAVKPHPDVMLMSQEKLHIVWLIGVRVIRIRVIRVRVLLGSVTSSAAKSYPERRSHRNLC